MHPLTATALRANLYKVLDQVIETGLPVEVEKNGKKIRIMAVKTKSKLENLVKRPEVIVGDPEAIVHIDWLKEWKEADNL